VTVQFIYSYNVPKPMSLSTLLSYQSSSLYRLTIQTGTVLFPIHQCCSAAPQNDAQPVYSLVIHRSGKRVSCVEHITRRILLLALSHQPCPLYTCR